MEIRYPGSALTRPIFDDIFHEFCPLLLLTWPIKSSNFRSTSLLTVLFHIPLFKMEDILSDVSEVSTPPHSDSRIPSMDRATSQLLFSDDLSSGAKVENDESRHSVRPHTDPIPTTPSTAELSPEDHDSARHSAKLDSRTSTILGSRASTVLGSLTGSKLSLATLIPENITPSQNSIPASETPAPKGDSVIDPEKQSSKNLTPGNALFDRASIPIPETQMQSQITDPTVEEGTSREKTGPAILSLFKKGPPTTSLEVGALEPWRMVLVNVALLLAGFMVCRQYFFPFIMDSTNQSFLKVGLDQSIIGN